MYFKITQPPNKLTS